MVGKVGGDLCKSHSDSTASSTPRITGSWIMEQLIHDLAMCSNYP